MAVIKPTRYAASVLVIPGKVYAASVAVRDTETTTYSTSVVVTGADDYTGELLQDPVIVTSIPNQFFGVTDVQPVQVQVANMDGRLSHLLLNDERGALVRIRRYDSQTGALISTFSGEIDRYQIGDDAQFSITPQRLSVLDQLLPRNVVSTDDYPTATDSGLPIPVFIGDAEDSFCPYVAFDDVEQTYDYLVGEDHLHIRGVKKNGIPSYVRPLSITTVEGSGVYNPQDFPPTLYLGADDDAAPGTYSGFFLKLTSGQFCNRIYRILSHDPTEDSAALSPVSNAEMEVDAGRPVCGGFVGYIGAWEGKFGTVPRVSNWGGKSYTTSMTGLMTMSIAAEAGQSIVVSTISDSAPSSIPDDGIGTTYTSLVNATVATPLHTSGALHLRVWVGVPTSTAAVTVSAGLFTSAVGAMKISTIYNAASSVPKHATVTSIAGAVSGAGARRRLRFDNQTLDGNRFSIIAFAGYTITPSGSPATAQLREFTLLGGVYGGTTIAPRNIFLDGAILSTRYVAHSKITLDAVYGDSPGPTQIAPDTLCQVQEYDEVYTTNMRTLVRFGRRQDSDGEQRTITASAARYTTPRKNMLYASSDLSDEISWVPSNALVTAVPDQAGPDGETGRVYSIGPRFAVSGISWALTQWSSVASLNEGITTFSANEKVTLSFWVNGGVGSKRVDYILQGNGSGGSSDGDVFNTSGVDEWELVTFTKDTDWGTGCTEVRTHLSGYVEVADFGDVDPVYLTDIQLERSAYATSHEPTSRRGRFRAGSMEWSATGAIADILGNPVWGMGEPVDTESVVASIERINETDGATAGSYPTVQARGVLPDLFGDRPTVKTVIDEIAQMRGIVVAKSGGVWSVTADGPETEVLQVFGTEETPYRNVTSLQVGEKPSIAETIKTLRTLYAPLQGKFGGNLEAFYASGIDRSTGILQGTERELLLRFSRGFSTSDRTASYIAQYTPYLERPLTFGAGQDARQLIVGQLIRVYAPRVQPENLVPHSTDMSAASWTVASFGSPAALTVTGNIAPGPFNQDYAATRVRFPAMTSGQNQQWKALSPTTVAPPLTGKVVGKIWMMAASNLTMSLRLEDAAAPSNATVQAFTLGPSWRQYSIEYGFNSTRLTAGVNFGLYHANSMPACTVWAARPQVNYDWARGYCPTDGTAAIPVTLHKITNLQVNGLDDVQITAIPYSTSIFDYTPSMAFVARVPDDLTVDTTTEPPGLPESLVVPPSSASGRDTVTIGGATFASMWAEIQFIMPTNTDGVRVQIQKLHDRAWTDVGTVHSAETSAGAAARVIAYGLMPSTTYVVRAVSFNRYGRVNGLDTEAEFTLS